jgi:hypothetical protein
LRDLILLTFALHTICFIGNAIRLPVSILTFDVINPLQYDRKKFDDISIFRMISNCLKILLQAVEGVRDVVGEAGDPQHKKDLL